MVAIGIRFPGGRYHATPWGRHVNEADVEWPPSPWRILRALIAVWHRKLDREVYPMKELEKLSGYLAESLPSYRLPDAVHSHVRHYMPVRDGKKDKNTLIFDGFVRVSPHDDMVICWHEVNLDETSLQLLDELLAGLAYLGRAESWVEARRLEKWESYSDCVPGDTPFDTMTGKVGEVVALYCPQSPSAFRALRDQWQQEGMAKGAIKKRQKGGLILPESWLEAVSLETSDLQASGWSQPPAARRVFYRRPSDSLKTSTIALTNKSVSKRSPVTTLRFALYGRPLPRMEDAVKIGEITRLALMHLAERHLGEIPALLSGHDLPAGNLHQHAFFLPECNKQGKIGHLLVHAPGGFDESSLRALQSLNHLFSRDGIEWQAFYEGAGDIADFSQISEYARTSSVWRSATPYLRPWHMKKNFGIAEQIRRECRLRALPETAEVNLLSEVPVGSVMRRAVHFYRFRNKRGLTQPDTHGALMEILFQVPVTGPLALGFGCHFGLGLFVPCCQQ